MSDASNKYWLNTVLNSIEDEYPDGEIVISSGISPSGSYHIGGAREILTADFMRQELVHRGRKARHLHVIDDFDPLRRRYDFLPEEFEKYVGWPISLVPDPNDCHESYAAHYFDEFYKHVKDLGVDVEVISSYQDLYKSGKMTEVIEQSVAQAHKIREILCEVSNRQLSEDWMPLQLLSDNNSFNEWNYSDIDTDSKEIIYVDNDGKSGRVSYKDGRVKLNWRVDWPARWTVLRVMVEPFSHQEHGAAGGSFDTGRRIVRQIFDYHGPIPGMQYGMMHLAGDSIKMSSSKGNVITYDQAFQIMPPSMLRYIYARYPAKKRIDFDPGLGLFNLMDEFATAMHAQATSQPHDFLPAYNVATNHQPSLDLVDVPFNHLVSVYQSAQGDEDQIVEALKRSGYQLDSKQKKVLRLELGYIANWLKLYAPESSKFSVQKTMPKFELTDEQTAFLDSLAKAIEENKGLHTGEDWHSLIHEVKNQTEIDPKSAFEAIYQLILAQEKGPKVGWFLVTLDKQWLIKRLKRQT